MLAAWLAQLDHLDRRLSRWVVSTARRMGRGGQVLAHVGAHLGDSVLWVGVGAWLWRRARTPAERARVQSWATALALALIGVLAVKARIRRPRPGRRAFLYGRGADVHSFPSGHGVRMGVNLVWLPHLVPGGRLWALLLALWVGWSRVALGIHYVGDVVAGCLMGMGIGAWTRRRGDKEKDAAFGKSAPD